jgi:hypothetical protein
VTTTGAITRTQCVTVPLGESLFMAVRMEREGACAVNPGTVSFGLSRGCDPCQPDCKSEKLTPEMFDAGNAYCSGTTDFCARCIKVYDFREEKGFSCLEYAVPLSVSGSPKSKPVRFLQCVDTNGRSCDQEVDCRKVINPYFKEE